MTVGSPSDNDDGPVARARRLTEAGNGEETMRWTQTMSARSLVEAADLVGGDRPPQQIMRHVVVLASTKQDRDPTAIADELNEIADQVRGVEEAITDVAEENATKWCDEERLSEDQRTE